MACVDPADERRGRSDPAEPLHSREMADVPIYIVHLSAGDAMEEVRRARERGFPSTRRPVPSICFFRTRITSDPDSRAPSS